MLALMLALAWAPVMSHCQLEAAGFEFLSCAAEDHAPANAPTHCDGASCCAAESGKYQAPGYQRIVPVLALVPLLFDVVADSDCASSPPISLDLLTTAPPELSPAWQFTLRAAPPSRAPSFVS